MGWGTLTGESALTEGVLTSQQTDQYGPKKSLGRELRDKFGSTDQIPSFVTQIQQWEASLR